MNTWLKFGHVIINNPIPMKMMKILVFFSLVIDHKCKFSAC